MLLKACVAEAVGVFGLCFIGGGAIYADAMMGDGGSGLLGIALAHGLILGIMITATMNVSGGHINPAVTIAMLITGRMKVAHAGAYIVAQLIGGVAAGFLLSGIIFADVHRPNDQGGERVVDIAMAATPHYDANKLGASRDFDAGAGGGYVKPDAMKAALRATLIEGVLTFFLVFAVFGTAVDPRHPNVGGFGVGLAVTVDILVGGPLTGAAMNPARFIGTGFMFSGPIFTEQWWVYCLGPIAGGAAAALIYHHQILEKATRPPTTPP
jgi:MIP family channel proteins